MSNLHFKHFVLKKNARKICIKLCCVITFFGMCWVSNFRGLILTKCVIPPLMLSVHCCINRVAFLQRPSFLLQRVFVVWAWPRHRHFPCSRWFLYFYSLAVIHFGVGTTSLKFKMWWVTGHVLIASSALLVMAWLHNVTMKLNMVPVLSAKNVSLEKHILMLIILDLAFHVEFVPNMKKSTINAIWHQIQSAENVTKASIVKD